ncbi:MAG TPA: CPXCG motif-containing cysteine-rich protein [Gammaproteobacteria bacterium]|nr:CPXCG motif-containing cysteine-rich protein [Gammaproteobacteria bacterium]
MFETESVGIRCPYCGEAIEIVVDCSVAEQKYIEDCAVCCRPISIAVTVAPDGSASVEASREDDA